MSQPTASKYKTCSNPTCGEYFDYDYRSSIHAQAIAAGWTVWQTSLAFVEYYCPKDTPSKEQYASALRRLERGI